MAVGDIISVARYNTLQSAIVRTLGNGDTTFGYGQSVQSIALASGNRVNATHMQRLQGDVTKCYAHQTGMVPPSLTSVVTQDDITDAVYAEYESIIQEVGDANNRFRIDIGEITTSQVLDSSRTASWGGSGDPSQFITHEFTVTFSNFDARRHFFNSGGQIRFAASLINGTNAKSTDWAGLLSSIGTVVFDYSQTTVTGTGNGSTIGNFELTSSFQTIFSKSGSGTYSDSTYIIEALAAANSPVITFKITFNDGENGFVDESVTGTVRSIISEQRATGFYVTLPAPLYQTTITLA